MVYTFILFRFFFRTSGRYRETFEHLQLWNQFKSLVAHFGTKTIPPRLINKMSKNSEQTKITHNQDSENQDEPEATNYNESDSSSDFETSRKRKLRRKSCRNVSFHYQALPMQIVGDNSVIIPDTPSSTRDITLNSAHIIEDSSDSEYHISNDTSNDEPANKSITFAARALVKTDLEFIRKERKRKKRPNRSIYKD